MSSACAPYWDALLELDQYTKDEIIFWKENIDLLSPGFVFWAESLTFLAFLMPVQLVVVQLSLLTRNTFVISFGIPHRAELYDTSGIFTGAMALNLKGRDDK